MLLIGCLAIIVASGFFCLAAPRSTSALKGIKATVLGFALLALGMLAVGHSHLGLAEALSVGLGVLMFALPCASWLLASRRTK